jgi:O-antigen/teichoic acid export membrane protein
MFIKSINKKNFYLLLRKLTQHKDILWVMAGEVFARVTSTLAAFIAAYLLGAESFGKFIMVKNTIGVVSTFSSFGLCLTAACYGAKYFHADSAKAGEILALLKIMAIGLGSIFMFLTFFFAAEISEKLLFDKSMSSSIKICSAYIFLSAINALYLGSLAGFKSFKDIASASASEGIIILVFTFPLIHLIGLNGAVAAFVIAQFTKFIILRYKFHLCCSQAAVYLKYANAIKHHNLLWQYSFPALLISLMYGPSIWVLNYITIHQEHGYKILGVLSVADQWKTLILFLPAAIGRVSFPSLANAHLTNSVTFKNLNRTNLERQFVFAIIVSIPIVICSGFIQHLYGSTFTGLGSILPIFALAGIFHVLANASGSALMTSENIWPNIILNLFWAMILIGAGFFLVPSYGMTGVAVTYLLAYFLQSILMVYLCLKH